MATETINRNLAEMGKRIINGKMLEGSEKDNILADNVILGELVEKAFNRKNNTINNLQAYHDLNALIVNTADVTAQADLNKIIGLVADYKRVNPNDFVKYDVNDRKTRVTSVYTATGTGVDFTRIPKHKRSVPASPRKHQFGIEYNISDMVNSPIQEFTNAVNLVKEEKIRYTLSQIYSCAKVASTNSKIPTKQVYDGANITFPDYKVIESSLLRRGGNTSPVIVGDVAIINKLAEAQATVMAGTTTPMYLTEELMQSLLRDIVIEKVSKSTAIAIDNPYVDETSQKVDLPVDTAIVIAGGNVSPFRVTDYGDMAVLEDKVENNIETETVHMKISYKVDITLLLGYGIGYIKDTSVTL